MFLDVILATAIKYIQVVKMKKSKSKKKKNNNNYRRLEIE
jgi:hypothetical protein